MDHAIARVASRQHGVIGGEQLVRLGLTQDEIDYRVSVGRLRRLHRGVFAVAVSLDEKAEFLAAVLAAGSGAVAGGLPSLALWDVRERRSDEPPEVMVPRDVRIPGVRVRRVKELHPRDTSTRHGVPVLMPAPALLEAATVLGERDLRRTVNEALVHKRTSIPALTALVARSGIGPDEVDVLFREQRVIVEADGGRFHDNPIARTNDAAKQARLEAQGYLVLRVRWRDLTNARTANQLQTATGSNP